MQKLLLIVFAISIQLNSLSQTVEGWIFDGTNEHNKTPLVGANVYWSGSNDGTVTDKTGYFELEKPAAAHMLVASFVGYDADTIHISGKQSIELTLFPGKELAEITVNERVKPTTISKLNPRFTQTIGNKELNRFACCNLSESFETNASVDVSYSDAVSGVKQIKLLGLAGRYSQLMMENIPILRGAETAFGLDYIPGTWMESIQVSKGSSAVKNGFESMTGQINIQYKEPFGEEKMHYYSYANQDGKLESNLGYVFPVSEKWKTSVLLHAATSIQEPDMNNDGFLDKPKTSIGTVLNRWQYNGEKINGKFGISFLVEQRDGGQVNFDHSKSFNTQTTYGVGIDVQKIQGFSKVGFMLNRPQTSIGTIVSANYFDRKSFYGHRTFDVEQLNIYTNLIFQSYLFSTTHSYNTGISLVYDNNETIFNDSAFSKSNLVPGVFLEYNYKPTEKFTMITGVRYDYSSVYKGFITPRIHLKYDFTDHLTLRSSIGKGYRSAYAISENSNLLASSRLFVFDEEIEQEEAWNTGGSIVSDYPLFGKEVTISVEFYHTNFTKKLIIDLEQADDAVHFYNLNGKAYANSFQAEISFEPFKQFDLTGAFRINDVQSTYENKLMQEPFVNRYKALLTAGYSTNMNKWKFDATVQFNGLSRLPGSFEHNAEQLGIDKPESYIYVLAQVTKNYKNWSFYIGVENLADYRQDKAIVDVSNPFGDSFDASLVWGPVYGRMFYAGIKYILINY